MSQDQDTEQVVPEGNDVETTGNRPSGHGRYRDEVFSLRVPAGKRTYFFDIKSTKSGEDFFLTITESKRIDESRYEKHKIFLYKEDFGKFVSACHEAIRFVRDDCLPDYEFRDLPNISERKDVPESPFVVDQ